MWTYRPFKISTLNSSSDGFDSQGVPFEGLGRPAKSGPRHLVKYGNLSEDTPRRLPLLPIFVGKGVIPSLGVHILGQMGQLVNHCIVLILSTAKAPPLHIVTPILQINQIPAFFAIRTKKTV